MQAVAVRPAVSKFILELEMLAAASVGQRFSVALWGSFILSSAPFCDKAYL